jgi:hypothetical protein
MNKLIDAGTHLWVGGNDRPSSFGKASQREMPNGVLR